MILCEDSEEGVGKSWLFGTTSLSFGVAADHYYEKLGKGANAVAWYKNPAKWKYLSNGVGKLGFGIWDMYVNLKPVTIAALEDIYEKTH